MRLPRVYHPHSLATDTTVELTGMTHHYLTHVLRMRADQPLILFNGQGGEFQAVITAIDKKKVLVTIEQFDPIERETVCHTHLGQVISRRDRMHFCLQKSVELGVSEITPLIADRSSDSFAKKDAAKRSQQWQEVVIAACQQCGRNRIPTVHLPISLMDWFARIKTTTSCKIALAPTASKMLADLDPSGLNDCLVLIGAEGGFSQREMLEINDIFQQVNLGPRVLRTETASIAVLSMLQVLQSFSHAKI